jgi:Xaa-Pro aminopeptidase
MDTSLHPAAPYCQRRRDRLARRFPGTTLIIPTGNPKVRANDTDYRFRPGTDFFYLTACFDPDVVLVLGEQGGEVTATLYLAHRRDERTHEFFTDARYGELWVGPRYGVEEAAARFGIATKSLDELANDLAAITDPKAVVRGFDASVDAQVSSEDDADHALLEVLSELRLTKDDFEVAQLQLAIDYTTKGFEDVVRALPTAVNRGERVIEGVFNLRARVEGNDVGYDTIAASGSHATILHWTKNDGVVRSGDLLLLDAGVECHNLYTADVTRTLPINGTFSPVQRKMYELVLAAQEAGIAAVKPGAPFMAAHQAAMQVLAAGLYEWGILKVEPEVALRPDQQLHRRYTLHGTSHMLGLDVHDCANARNDDYLGELKEGYVLTVEPGLYFQANDLTVPEEYRGIGVRIEDDVLVTADGSRVLSRALPRTVPEIEAWMARVQGAGAPHLGL